LGGSKLLDVKIEKLTSRSFAPFGTVVGPDVIKPQIANSEFTFWNNIDDIRVGKGTAQLAWLNLKKANSYTCDTMERHKRSSTTIVPMIGSAVILFSLSDERSLPDPNSIKAFYFDGSVAANMNPGVWFWNRYPLFGQASLLFILEKSFHINDVEMVDLRQTLQVTLRLVLEGLEQSERGNERTTED
jgi:ureidoglycolate lyase